jgi:chromosomal replication initiator protein
MWIKDNYQELISDSVKHVAGKKYQIDFRSRDEFGELPTELLTEENSSPSPAHTEITPEFALRNNLNPRYTFESFVVGSCNQFARAAALSVADNLGGSYNPLFIYGGVGLGKTHLMSAVGYEVISRDSHKKVSFISSEEFTNDMISAIRFDRMVDFRNKYRNLDLLMIDDIQFIAGKDRTQEEFFHTFNSIYEGRKQIIITSDRFPNAIDDMEHRLRSRFSWGLVADIGIPDFETKVAILKRKAAEDSIHIPDDVAYFLAENVESNIRELVGCLVRVIAMSTLQARPLSRDLAQTALKEILHAHSKTITVEDIIVKVAKAFNVKPSDIKSKKKHKLFSIPRQVGMFLARELTQNSYPEIGAAFGGKDHSTVIYGARKIEQRLSMDHSLKMLVDGIRDEIRR